MKIVYVGTSHPDFQPRNGVCHLTKYKIYDSIPDPDLETTTQWCMGCYHFFNDVSETYAPVIWFITLGEFRRRQLNMILKC
jgi:hypothetical protein